MSDGTDWRFTWIRGDSAIRESEFRERWQSLADSTAGTRIFDEPEVVLSWLDSKGAALQVVPEFCWAQSCEGANIMLPLCRAPSRLKNGFHRRLLTAGEPHFDYQAPLGLTNSSIAESFWAAFAAELERSGHCESAMVCRIVDEVAPTQSPADQSAFSPYIPMSHFRNWESYFASRSGNLRSDVRRRIRRLEEQGPVSLRVFTPDEFPAAHQELLRLRTAYERLWGGTPSGGLFQLPGTLAFYQRLLKSCLPRGWVHFSVLFVGPTPVSWHLGFLHRGVLHWYKPTYEKMMEAFSPGKVHLTLLLQRGFSEGWREFDFGCGTENYKYLWTDEQRSLKSWEWTSNTIFDRWLRSLRNSARYTLSACRRTGFPKDTARKLVSTVSGHDNQVPGH